MGSGSRLAVGMLAVVPFLHPGGAAGQDRDVALVHRLLLDRQAIVREQGGDDGAATLGQRLSSGDLVLTSANTRAAIRFTDDGSLVRLNPNSSLQLTTDGGGALAKTLELEFGELWARVSPQQGSFQVRTPSGVAAVKGTEFIVRVDAAGATTVLTLEGALDFFNDAGTVEVGEGRRASATSNGQPPVEGGIEEGDLTGLADLIEEAVDDDVVRVEIPLQNGLGVVRTLILELPASQARTILGVGGRR